MARYTHELHDLVKQGVRIFDFPYAFYNESKKQKFETDFIRHFYFREICSDSVDKFKILLEDKFQTVFPYYNKLFEAAAIEYNILDNYNIKEELTVRREKEDKTSGVSSTVGQVFDNQTSDVKDSRNNESVVTDSKTGNREDIETVHSEATEQGSETVLFNKRTENSTTDNKTTTVNGSTSTNNTKKFLDTPQGALDLNRVDYLTNLTQDNGGTTSNETTAERGTSNTEGSENGNDSKTSNKKGEQDSERKLSSTDSQEGSVNGQDKSEGEASSVFSGEQRSTQDNNTRTESVGSQVETSVFTKKGNIGIDTDSDMINKHIKLQQILQKIELMFFDECEDLFMLIY